MAEEKGRIISIYSPKGGSGVTVTSVNLATGLCMNTQKNVLLLSIEDFYTKDLVALFDINFKYYLSSLNMGKLSEKTLPGYMNDYSIGKKKLSIMPFAEDHNDIGKIQVVNLGRFLDIAKKVFDYIIIGNPSVLNESVKTAFDFSDVVFLTTLPEIPSMINMKEALALFKENLYPNELFKVIVNQQNIKNALKAEEVKEALGLDIFYQLPFDPENVIDSLQVGKPVIELHPKSAFAQEITKLAQIIEKGKGEGKTKIFAIITDVMKKRRKERIQTEAGAAEKEKEPKKAKGEDLNILYNNVKQNIHKKLVTEIKLDLNMAKSKLETETRKIIDQLLAEEKESPRDRVIREKLVSEILDEALGLGPLEPLLKNPDITEIMVINKDETYVEKKGKLQLADIKFLSDKQLLKFIERIVTPLGRRIDDSSPYVDARLLDGSRVHAIIPPLALKGPTLTIRKFFKEKLKPDDLIRFGSASGQMLEFLNWSVLIRKNIVISGGTGSGKTTLLNILSGFIPEDERIITVEDSAELQLQQPHVVRLESRPPSIEGTGAVTIRDLVRNTLRMRPDRIVVGECRGGEALDMLQAMNTGHDGSLTTVHSNSPRDCIRRLETLCLMAGMELPSKAIREQIGSAIDLIVQIGRLSDGSRKMLSVSEVTGMEGDVVTLQELFCFRQTGLDQNKKVKGVFSSTGIVPSFMEELKAKGIKVDMKIFHSK
ncbi:MAG: Flp pilus assembly complex ATPase component TadA [Spirochaetes bacterium]|nr:Flp pilus assembly complex ATPase component TadA [Spirochaetota bacterium]